MSNQPPFSKIPYIAQLLILLGLVLFMAAVMAGVGGFIAQKVYNIPDLSEFMNSTAIQAEYPNAFLMLQAFQSIGAFILPAIIFAAMIVHSPVEYYKLDRPFDAKLLLIVLGIAYFMGALVNLSSEVNKAIPLPDSLKWLTEKSEEVQQLYEILLNIDSPLKFIVVLVVAAVLPAIGEELIFRGALQNILIRWTANAHIGVWIAAIIFSAIHFQVDYFLPRLLLGAIFGYLVIWSGNLWYAILAHFLNNAFAVVVAYYYKLKGEDIDLEEVGDFSISISILFILILFSLLYFFHKEAKKQSLQTDE